MMIEPDAQLQEAIDMDRALATISARYAEQDRKERKVRYSVYAVCFLAFLLLMAFLVTPARAAQPVPDPVNLKAKDIRPLIADDIATYLDRGESAVPWSMHRVTAQRLAEDFAQNEVAAQRQYGDGSDIIITGTVRSVSVTINKPMVNLVAGQFRQVPALMKPGHDDWLATIKPGQKVQVACRRVRAVLGMAGAFDCEPRAAYVTRMTDVYFYSLHGLAKQGDPLAVKLYRIASGG